MTDRCDPGAAPLDEVARQFQTIVTHVADGILIIDADGVVLFANPATEQLLGRSAAELIGSNLGQPIVVGESTEMTVMRKGGSLVTVELRTAEVTWEGVPAVLASLRDVSDRIQAQTRIEHLNSVLRAIRNVNQLIVHEKDPARLVQQACELLIETRGYIGARIAVGDGRAPPENFAYAGWGERFEPLAASLRDGQWPPCWRDCVASEDVIAIRDPKVACEGCPLSGAYQDRTALVVALRHGGKVLGHLGVSIPGAFGENKEEMSLLAEVAADVALALHTIESDRLQRESEARFKVVTESSPDAIFLTDRTGHYIYVNRAASELLGYSIDELTRMSIADLAPKEKVQDDLQTFQELLAKGKLLAEIELVRRDGTVIPVDINAVLLPNGKVYGSCRDLTARKQAEEALRSSEARLKLAQQVAHIGHWELDAYDGTPVWSEEIFRIFGLDPEAGEPSFASHNTLVDPEDWPLLDEAVRAGFENGEPFDLVIRIQRPGQRPGWMQAIGTATRDDQGKVVSMFGTAQDISEHMQAEGQLKILSRFPAENPFPVLRITAEGILLYANPSADPLLQAWGGCEPDQSVPPDWVKRVADVYATGEKKSFEVACSDRKYEFSLCPIPRASYVNAYGHDITDREKARLDLLSSEARFRLVFDNTTDGILLIDAATRKLVLGNKALCNLLGYTLEELMELSVADIHPPEALPEIEQAFASLVEGTQNFGETVAVKRKDGSVLETDIGATSFKYHDRLVLVASFRDVTEKRNLQAQLAQADRLSSMGMLAAGVAHEINNPLSYILYNLESLTEDLPALLDVMHQFQTRLYSHLDPEILEDLVGDAGQKMNAVALDDIHTRFKDALEGTRRIHNIVRGLGTFSRVEQDRLVPVNLVHVIDVAINMAFNEIKYRARLVKDYSKVPTILASAGRLSQVFLNLIINATHAVPEGDVENNEIRIRTWTEADEVCAEVRDTGSGIAPELVGKLFDPFFTTKKIGAGSGLGLAISKNIVDGYGGTIQVSSEVGKGTSFVIRLPAKQQEEDDAVAETPSAATKTPSVRGRILIVDDEAGIRSAMARMLRGHETVQAANGAEAIAILEKDQAFDLLLCDMMMPDISGMDLHEWLTERQPQLAKQLIFITGGAFTPRARDYLSKVDNIRLEKPFDVTNFKKIVGELVQLAKKR
jgi:PAS domain S-box-containing protein